MREAGDSLAAPAATCRRPFGARKGHLRGEISEVREERGVGGGVILCPLPGGLVARDGYGGWREAGDSLA